MNISKRFDQALDKLYLAFHSGQLNPECSKQCAVGNICDNKDGWKNLTDRHGSTELNYVGLVNEAFGRKINGFSPSELLHIEAEFLKACGYSVPLDHRGQKPDDPTSPETLFKGLCAAVSYLCHLEGIADVMDYSELFNFEPSKTSRALSTQEV